MFWGDGFYAGDEGPDLLWGGLDDEGVGDGFCFGGPVEGAFCVGCEKGEKGEEDGEGGVEVVLGLVFWQEGVGEEAAEDGGDEEDGGGHDDADDGFDAGNDADGESDDHDEGGCEDAVEDPVVAAAPACDGDGEGSAGEGDAKDEGE